jgi:glycosyltransferase involved in cell wall biosynthesis
MSNSTQNILVISERTPRYVGGSGDQKILYTSYFQMPNIQFFILNDGQKKNNDLENQIDYFELQEENSPPAKKWRYADFLRFFSMNHERFIRSENYLSQIVPKVQEIIAKNDIQCLVFEQTGILMWSWSRYFMDKVQCVLRIHDSHYHYLLSDQRTRKKIPSKLALLGSAAVQRGYEKKHIRQWDQIQFLSLKEYQYYCKKYSNIKPNLVYTPPAIVVDRNEYLFCRDKNTDILFVGSMNWKPNTDAVTWFLSQVLPLIKLKLPKIKVKIIGKNAFEKIEATDRNVEVMGFVHSLEDEYRSAKLFINPSRSGGGVKVKLMDAAAFGLPVISTSDGISGFKDNIQDCVMVRNKPMDFASAVIELLSNEKVREEFSGKIFEYANHEFNVQENQKLWKAAVSRLL